MVDRRVLALTTSFPLRQGASAGVFVRHLYQNLPQQWKVVVVCPNDTGALKEAIGVKEGAAKLEVCPVDYAPRAWRVLAQQSGGVMPGLRHAPWRALLVPVLLAGLAWRCLRSARSVELIHANWAICGAIAGKIGKYAHRPVVTTLRGDDVTRAGKSRLEAWLLDAAVSQSQAVVCVSDAMAKDLRDRYPERAQDIHVCLNGVDDAFLHMPAMRLEQPGCLRIASVGSLIRRKGYDVLIDAVARMQCRIPVSVKIAGEGPEREQLLELAAQLGIANCFEFVGEIAPDQIPSFLGQADIFVLPSRSEGRPNVVVEALAAGLPVVCSALPGVEGLVESGANGWVVGIDDADAIAKALDEAAAMPMERLRRGLAARERMRASPHGWREAGARYSALFDDVLAKWLLRSS